MTDLRTFCLEHGVILDRDPPLGQWRRFKTVDKPRNRNGAVKFMGDVAFIQNHATMDTVAVWKANGHVSPVAQRELAAIRTNEIKRRMRAVNEMRAYFAGLLPLRGSHPYIERKGLNLAGCGKVKVDGDLMVIPMFRHGALTSVQTIAPDGAKKYRYGCPSRGCSLELQHYGWAVTCLVEGFATGLAVYQSMPTARVLVCFDAGNMVLVAQELRLTGMCVVCADNDHATAARIGSNPGIEKGALAAGAIGCGMAYPDGIDGSDWCDALQAWGETGPAKLRMEIMRNARHVRPPG